MLWNVIGSHNRFHLLVIRQNYSSRVYPSSSRDDDSTFVNIRTFGDLIQNVIIHLDHQRND